MLACKKGFHVRSRRLRSGDYVDLTAGTLDHTVLNKPMFGVIVEPTPFADIPTEMTAEWQLDSGLIASLEGAQKAAGMAWPRSDIRDAVSDGRAGIAPLLAELADAKARQLGATESRRAPTIIIAIDQV
jgi:hypothetical protein